eukprot:2385224-Rhodomonas_salina.2
MAMCRAGGVANAEGRLVRAARVMTGRAAEVARRRIANCMTRELDISLDERRTAVGNHQS